MFEHIAVWGSRTQKRWFNWQRLQLESSRTALPIVCRGCDQELKLFVEFPCPCGAKVYGVGHPAQTPASA